METRAAAAPAAAFALLAAAACLQGCSNPIEGNCGAGPVGSCSYGYCYPTRGPTQCIGNSCMCAQGYCQYGDTHKRCRAEVPDSTCTVSHMCWKGGLVSSTCVDGHCLCRSEMHIGPDGACHSGWWPQASEMLAAAGAAANATQLSEEDWAVEDREVALNVALAAAWCALPLAATAGAVLGAGRALRRARAVEPGAPQLRSKLLGGPGGGVAGAGAAAA